MTRRISMTEFQFVNNEAKPEHAIRKLIFVMLRDLGIDPTIEIGLRAVESFRSEIREDGDVDRATPTRRRSPSSLTLRSRLHDRPFRHVPEPR